MIFKES